MRSELILTYLLLFFFFQFKTNRADGFVEPVDSVIHEIKVQNPVDHSVGVQQLKLIEKIDKNGFPIEYSMDVNSVYCLDSICKIVPVRISWDLLGEYQFYGLETPNILEKRKGAPFSKSDYQKLDMILRDKDSELKDISVNDITKATYADGVDAVSGATTIILEENATVKGAALTCYTLWQWTYSMVRDTIRDLAGNRLNLSKLKDYLSDNDDFKKFAVEQLTRKLDYSDSTVAKVLQTSMADTIKWSKLQIAYIKNAPDNVYLASIQFLLKQGQESQQIAALKSLKSTTRSLPPGYLNQISKTIPSMNSYQTVDLFLKLIETKNSSSSIIIGNLFPLLDKQFLIARRVYWYLSSQTTTVSQHERLEEFRIKHDGFF